MRKEITPQDLEDMLALYQMGVSLREITLTLRIPYSQIYKHINRFKLILPPKQSPGQFLYSHPLFNQLKKGVLTDAVIHATKADAR
jgi:hypothetical protein